MERSAGANAIVVDRDRPSSTGARVEARVEWLLGLVLIAVVVLNVVNALGRHLFAYSFTGADELMVYAVIFVVMAGAVLALARRRHINVNLLPSYASGRARHALDIVHDLVALGATSFATYASWSFVSRIDRLGTTSMTLGIPMTIPHSAVFLAFCGMGLVAAILLVRDILAFIADEPTPPLEIGG